MRVVFLGTPEFAVPSLRALLASSHEICAVFTQPDRPSGRGQRLQPPPVKIHAESAGIPVYQPPKIRSEENRPLIQSLGPDFIVVVAFGQILPPWLLQAPRLGPVNVHASLLPRYRGAAPVVWALVNGERVTGVTTMLMDEHLDTGPILLQREIAADGRITGGELAAELAEAGAELLIPTLEGLANRTIRPLAQDDSLATYAPRITKEMSWISWDRPSLDLHNLIRALNPWPLACTMFDGRRLQLFRSSVSDFTGGGAAAGTFLGTAAEGMRIACGDGTGLELLEVQLESRKRVSGREFATGARLVPGTQPFGRPAV
jgi:methionyl-tRNA formyltransferase